jgi:hypothetical protein
MFRKKHIISQFTLPGEPSSRLCGNRRQSLFTLFSQPRRAVRHDLAHFNLVAQPEPGFAHQPMR